MLTKEKLAKPEGFQGAIFDLDGTLIDSMPAWLEVDRKFFADRNLPYDPTFSEKVAPLSVADSAKYAIETYHLSETVEDIVAYLHQCVKEEYQNRIPLKEGVLDYLKLLKKHKIPMTIATASTRELATMAVERLEIGHFFEEICTIKDVGKPKGFPDICFYAAKKIGIDPKHCVMFEDALPGMKSAKSAGMKVCALYDPSADAERHRIEEIADVSLHSFEELIP